MNTCLYMRNLLQRSSSRLLAENTLFWSFALCIGLVATNALADDPICINALSTNFPLPPAPTINGDIESDVGWLEASQYDFANGTSSLDGQVQLTRDASNVYVSVQIGKLKEFHPNTRFILLVGPNPTDRTKDIRIEVKPTTSSGSASNSFPSRLKVWKDSTVWPNTYATTNYYACDPNSTANTVNCNPQIAPNFEAKVTAVDGPVGEKALYLEMRISLTELSSPASVSDIKFAFNTLRVWTDANNKAKADQMNWPAAATIVGAACGSSGCTAPIEDSVMAAPVFSTWGTARLNDPGQSCSGVRVADRWINVVGNPDGMSAPAAGAPSVTNRLFVKVENSGSADAGHILAKISSWRFGSALNPLGLIGPPNVGTVSPAQPLRTFDLSNPGTGIPAGTSKTLQLDWTLSASEYQTLLGSPGYVCSRVELDVDPVHTAGVARTHISNRGNYWNIHLAPASVFRNAALLDSRGYERHATSPTEQRFDIHVATREVPPLRRDDRPGLTAGGLTTPDQARLEKILQTIGGLAHYREGARYFVKTVCPERHTGRFVQLEGSGDVELMERAPCFEYWIYHRGPFARWIDELKVPTGSGLPRLEPLGPGVYTIALPFDSTVELETRIEAVESGPPSGQRMAAWVAVGRAMPGGSFNTTHNGGLAVTLGFEYELAPTYSIEATLGRNRFRGQSGATDIDVTQLGLNAKWYITPQPLRWFATAGVASYAFDPGSTRFGSNVGAGLQIDVAPNVSLEARYQLNLVSGNAPNSRFSTLQLGARLAF